MAAQNTWTAMNVGKTAERVWPPSVLTQAKRQQGQAASLQWPQLGIMARKSFTIILQNRQTI